jgi:hypothetical protein
LKLRFCIEIAIITTWSKRRECPDKRTATTNKANKRKPVRLVELELVLAQVSNQAFTCQRDPCGEKPLSARAHPPRAMASPQTIPQVVEVGEARMAPRSGLVVWLRQIKDAPLWSVALCYLLQRLGRCLREAAPTPLLTQSESSISRAAA